MNGETAFAFGADNLSMPAATVIPVLQYPDAALAAQWLCRAFGFEERLRIGSHRVQLAIGSCAVVVTEGLAAGGTPLGHSLMVRVRDVDAHFGAAAALGVEIVAAPETFAYGERQYTAKDTAGHIWTFSESVRDVRAFDVGREARGRLTALVRFAGYAYLYSGKRRLELAGLVAS